MSTRREGTCREPGPRGAHCTDHPGHKWSCYDAGDDVSWNDGQWYDFDLAPHACDDPDCPDQSYRGPKGRESEYGQVKPCTNEFECDADEHMVACPSRHRDPVETPTLADAGATECDASWSFDVDFDVACSRTGDHDEHLSVIDGNGGVTAHITWRTA